MTDPNAGRMLAVLLAIAVVLLIAGWGGLAHRREVAAWWRRHGAAYDRWLREQAALIADDPAAERAWAERDLEGYRRWREDYACLAARAEEASR